MIDTKNETKKEVPVYIKFNLDRIQSEGKKTNVWEIVTIDDRRTRIYQMERAWRGYAFFPGYGTLFEPNCLKTIITFIETANADHREQLKNEKAALY